jgi:hypothetical protein
MSAYVLFMRFLQQTLPEGSMKRKKYTLMGFVLLLAVAALPAATPALIKDSLAVKDSTARPAYGRMSITTEPPQAEVSLDSVAKGESPITLDSVTPGTHTLIIKKKGYFGKKVSVDMPGDSMVDVMVTLVAPGCLVVTSVPPGAGVFLDGKDMGVTPSENAKLKPGAHALIIQKDGFAAFEKQITISEGKTDSLSIVLQPKPAAKATGPAAEKSKPVRFDRVAAIVVGCVFVVFGIVLLSVEMQETAK